MRVFFVLKKSGERISLPHYFTLTKKRGMKTQTMKQKNSYKRVLGYFLGKYKEKKWSAISLLGIKVAISGLSVLPFIYLKELVDILSTVASKNTIPNLIEQAIGVIFIILGIRIVIFLLYRILDFILIKFETYLMQSIFLECFNYTHQHSYGFFANAFSGALVKKVNKLVYSLEDFTDIIIFQLSSIVVESIGIIIVVSRANLMFGVLFGSFILSIVLLQYFMQKWRAKFEIEANKTDSEMSGYLSDTISNSINLKVFASLKREFSTFKKLSDTRRKKTQTSWFSSILIFALTGMIIIGFEFGILWYAVQLWGNGLITVGVVILVQSYMLRLIQHLFFIGNMFKRLTALIGKSAEMIEILDTPWEIKDRKHAKDLVVKQGKITLEDVKFSYNDNEDVIFSNLNLTIKPGEKVAFVGASGAGKTSIIKLLMRFYDIQGGKILINGQDISKITQESLRNSISLVPQEPILFHRTIKENIAYGKPDASDEEIFAAAKMARCDRFIQKLEKKYDTLVGERGIKLSGGERQRVAIARAILENKSILLLDEATSALDSESEILIQEAMQEVMKNKTTIVIAHRLSTIMSMDRIIVLDNGNIVEQGSHTELMNKKNGQYAHLWNIQSGGFIG
ncbi:MAG: ABC transporter [candidate division SR1 bacterium]|nr:MAG: ABC transporter [candidate division SR1 bacterium]